MCGDLFIAPVKLLDTHYICGKCEYNKNKDKDWREDGFVGDKINEGG